MTSQEHRELCDSATLSGGLDLLHDQDVDGKSDGHNVSPQEGGFPGADYKDSSSRRSQHHVMARTEEAAAVAVASPQGEEEGDWMGVLNNRLRLALQEPGDQSNNRTSADFQPDVATSSSITDPSLRQALVNRETRKHPLKLSQDEQDLIYQLRRMDDGGGHLLRQLSRSLSTHLVHPKASSSIPKQESSQTKEKNNPISQQTDDYLLLSQQKRTFTSFPLPQSSNILEASQKDSINSLTQGREPSNPSSSLKNWNTSVHDNSMVVFNDSYQYRQEKEEKNSIPKKGIDDFVLPLSQEKKVCTPSQLPQSSNLLEYHKNSLNPFAQGHGESSLSSNLSFSLQNWNNSVNDNSMVVYNDYHHQHHHYHHHLFGGSSVLNNNVNDTTRLLQQGYQYQNNSQSVQNYDRQRYSYGDNNLSFKSFSSQQQQALQQMQQYIHNNKRNKGNHQSLSRMEESPKKKQKHHPQEHLSEISTKEEQEKRLVTYEKIRRRPFRCIGLEEDSRLLSSFLCFIRKEFIEVFRATKLDVRSRQPLKKIKLNQVGLRCRFCVYLPPSHRAKRSSCFPSSIDRIYQSTKMIIREHFPVCSEIIPEIRHRYAVHVAIKRDISSKSKAYWVSSANRVGMRDSDCGKMILMEGDEGTEGKSEEEKVERGEKSQNDDKEGKVATSSNSGPALPEKEQYQNCASPDTNNKGDNNLVIEGSTS